MTLRQILRRAEEKFGETPALLQDEPVCPDEFLYHLSIYRELRSSQVNSSSTISFQEMDAYCRMMDLQLTPLEVSVIREIDNTVISSRQKYAREHNQQSSSEGLSPSTQRAILKAKDKFRK